MCHILKDAFLDSSVFNFYFFHFTDPEKIPREIREWSMMAHLVHSMDRDVGWT